MLSYETHAVENVVAALADVNLYAIDLALRDAVVRNGAAHEEAALFALGAHLGRAEMRELARLANQYPPRLQQYDGVGHRIDEVEFHPAWHSLMGTLIEQGAHASPWLGGKAAQVTRAARYLMFGQVENGSQCPVTMTYASVPALRQAPRLAAKWLPKILTRQYDPRSLPIEQKRGALIGMGMTEKQGGSDVRRNTTRAQAVAAHVAQELFGDDGAGLYRVVGHKWFFSAPQSDAHLILAQTEGEDMADCAGGLSCLLLPRFLPNGERNQIRVQRLKDKLGNRSNASSEVEFTGAYGWLLGVPGRGLPTILEMASHTRLDCILGSAGAMRAALVHALHHARERLAFGRYLDQQPLMQNVLADLALESEAATVFAMRLARCFDDMADPAQAQLARLLTPAGKYWICKRGPGFAAEAMEVIGGNGYVEDSPLARFYRELPVNSIWEGSGNIMCLDLLRALAKSPAAQAALAAELALAGDGDGDFTAYRSALLADLQCGEAGARLLAERIVLAVQAGLLLRHAPAYVSSAFIASRIRSAPGGAYGRLPQDLAFAPLLARALPVVQ